MKLLGWLLGGGCKAADPSKLDGVKKLAPPKDVNDIRSFLGAGGWYRDLNPNFGRQAAPLTQLLKKNAQFVWGADQ